MIQDLYNKTKNRIFHASDAFVYILEYIQNKIQENILICVYTSYYLNRFSNENFRIHVENGFVFLFKAMSFVRN